MITWKCVFKDVEKAVLDVQLPVSGVRGTACFSDLDYQGGAAVRHRDRGRDRGGFGMSRRGTIVAESPEWVLSQQGTQRG